MKRSTVYVLAATAGLVGVASAFAAVDHFDLVSQMFPEKPLLAPLPDDPSCPHAMARIPGGRLPDDASLRPRGRALGASAKADVGSFCLDRSPVTAGEFATCVAAGLCATPIRTSIRSTVFRETVDTPHVPQDKQVEVCNIGVAARINHPMNCLNFAEAEAYCHAYKKRLPTPSERYFASHGGPTRSRYPWGNDTPNDSRLCWSGVPPETLPWKERHHTCVIRSYPPDPLGLFDMFGNVTEFARELPPCQFFGQDEKCGELVGNSFTAFVRESEPSVDIDYADSAFIADGPNAEDMSGSSNGFRCAK